MPTHTETDRFWRDWRGLTKEQKKSFRKAVKDFIEDLATGQFRKGLRVGHIEGTDSIFEMTWEGSNGRATFQYGPEVQPGQAHVIWRRVGTHDIFRNP